MITEDGKERLNELIRKELGIYSATDLESTFRSIEDLSGTNEKEFSLQVVAALPVLDNVIKWAIWGQYDLLAKFNEDYSALAKGGINALSVLQEFLRNVVAKYEQQLQDSKGEFDEHNPISEQ